MLHHWFGSATAAPTTAASRPGASCTDRSCDESGDDESDPAAIAVCPSRFAISVPSPAMTNRTAERSDSATSTSSSNPTVSIPVPRSSDGRPAPSRTGTGPAVSGRTSRAEGSNGSSSFPDRSDSAPGSRATSSTGPETASAAAAAVFWAGVSMTVRLALPCRSDGGWDSDAPPSPISRSPDRSTTSRRERSADRMSTCSSNATASVPAARSSTGGPESSSRGAVPSRTADRPAEASSDSAFPDRSATAPASSRMPRAAPAAASAFWSGVSRTTSVSESASPAATSAGASASAAPPPSRSVPSAGSSRTSSILDTLADAAETCSSNRTASVPSPKSSRGGTDTSIAGGDASASTSTWAALTAPMPLSA